MNREISVKWKCSGKMDAQDCKRKINKRVVGMMGDFDAMNMEKEWNHLRTGEGTNLEGKQMGLE